MIGYRFAVGLFCALALLGRGASADEPGRIEISRGDSGLQAILVNPAKAPSASVSVGYNKDKQNCNNNPAITPCFVFGGFNGQASLPVTAPPCTVVNGANSSTAFCKADGIGSVGLSAPTGGILNGMPRPDVTGKHCLPVALKLTAGPVGTYMINAADGCPETIVCTGTANFGVVSVDASDAIVGPCKSVIRQ